MLVEHGVHFKFTDNWAQNGEANGYDLKNSNSPRTTERRAADVSTENPAVIKWHYISKNLALNFDQTSLSYITVGNNTLELEGAKSIPVKGKAKGKQITVTFAICYFCHWPIFTDAVDTRS